VIDIKGDDPAGIVGSYNWTNASAHDHDKRKPIIHDRELARAYHAEWQRL
jgi:phosphatidylserine/phosphatidylglycerophosphate/cardiolipin synthase-like enzyme